MKLTLSFAFAAIALLQVTAAVPVVDKRVVKPSAGLVAEGSPDVEDVEKRVVKPFAALVAARSQSQNSIGGVGHVGGVGR